MRMIRLFAPQALRLSRSVAGLAACLAVAVASAACGPGGASGSAAPGGRAQGRDDHDRVRRHRPERRRGGSTVYSIIPPGVGPEDYEPKPADARLLGDAQLVVSNGVGLDDFLDACSRPAAAGRRRASCSAKACRR